MRIAKIKHLRTSSRRRISTQPASTMTPGITAHCSACASTRSICRTRCRPFSMARKGVVAWELGYAYARNKPVIDLRTDFRPGAERGMNVMLSRSCRYLIREPSFHEDVKALAKAVVRRLGRLDPGWPTIGIFFPNKPCFFRGDGLSSRVCPPSISGRAERYDGKWLRSAKCATASAT